MAIQSSLTMLSIALQNTCITSTFDAKYCRAISIRLIPTILLLMSIDLHTHSGQLADTYIFSGHNSDTLYLKLMPEPRELSIASFETQLLSFTPVINFALI
jgi:hypothetical protein